MCSLRFENNLLTFEGVRFASMSKKTPISKLSFAFVSLALPLLDGILLYKILVLFPCTFCRPGYFTICAVQEGWMESLGGQCTPAC
jgi:hypothetical protein